MSLLITPQTKVGDLLAAYPALEEILIAQSPHFARLRNPILRRTVGKVATLQAAAMTGGVEVVQLVRVLREAVGQDTSDIAATPATAAAGSRPAWIDDGRVIAAFDVDEILNGGEHPLTRVTVALRGAAAGDVVHLTSPFRPEPLLEKLAADGYRAFTEPVDEGWVTHVAR
jgi:hypothetical protein